MNARRQIAVIIACALAIVIFFSVEQRRYSAIDFTIFYCAGEAVNQAKSPYLLEPLRTCEHRIWPRSYLSGGYAEPAALPGYALVPFALLARLPFAAAKDVWLILSALGFGIAVAAGAQLSRLSPIAVFALLFVPVASLSITVGQLGPFIVAPLFAAAYLLRRGYDDAAALAVLVCAVEPHIAVPAAAALFALVPRSRTFLAAGALLFLAAHIAVLHYADALAYFTQLLPAMSRAENAAADQYGMYWLLHTIGVPAAFAGIAANALYVAGIIGGIQLARGVLRTGSGDRAMVIALPVALALLVSPYLHDVQLCAALTAPLAALGMHPGDRRWITAAVLLSIPWYGILRAPALALEAIAGAAIFAAFADARPIAGAAFTAAAAIAILFSLRVLPLAAAQHADLALGAPMLAAQSWNLFLNANPPLEASGPGVLVPKMLAWIALAAMAPLTMRIRSKAA